MAFSVTVPEGVELPLFCTRLLSVSDFYQFSQNPVESNEVFQDQSSGRPSRHNAHLAILPHFLSDSRQHLLIDSLNFFIS